MNTTTKNEITEVAKTQSAVGAMAVVTLSPEKYAAEVYQPYKAKLSSAIDSVRAIEYDIKTTAGMAVAVKARALFRDLRVEADKERKARKEPITKIGKLLEAGFDQVEERISPLEELFDADIKAEEKRKEDEKAAKIALERQRIEAIQAAIQRIRDLPLQVVGATAEVISAMIGALVATEPGPDFEEFIDQAKAVRSEVLEKLAKAEATQRAVEVEAESRRQEAARAAAEAEEARKVEAARVEAERAELARQRAENERIANEQAAERKRLADLAEAQEAAARAQREQAEANLRAEREAQEAAIKAEQDKLAAERKALDDERAAAAKAVADAAALEIAKAEAIAADETRIRLRSAMSLEELADAAPMDELLPTDAEIREIGAEFGMTLPEWVERLDLFVIAMRTELAALRG